MWLLHFTWAWEMCINTSMSLGVTNPIVEAGHGGIYRPSLKTSRWEPFYLLCVTIGPFDGGTQLAVGVDRWSFCRPLRPSDRPMVRPSDRPMRGIAAVFVMLVVLSNSSDGPSDRLML